MWGGLITFPKRRGRALLKRRSPACLHRQQHIASVLLCGMQFDQVNPDQNCVLRDQRCTRCCSVSFGCSSFQELQEQDLSSAAGPQPVSAATGRNCSGGQWNGRKRRFPDGCRLFTFRSWQSTMKHWKSRKQLFMVIWFRCFSVVEAFFLFWHSCFRAQRKVTTPKFVSPDKHYCWVLYPGEFGNTHTGFLVRSGEKLWEFPQKPPDPLCHADISLVNQQNVVLKLHVFYYLGLSSASQSTFDKSWDITTNKVTRQQPYLHGDKNDTLNRVFDNFSTTSMCRKQRWILSCPD